MKMLSIDPGKNMGWAIWSGDKLLSSGVYKFKPKVYEDVIAELKRVLPYALKGIEQVVFEYPVVGLNRGNAPIKQGEFIRVIKDACISLNVPWLDMNPGTIKKYATGNGRAKKADIRQAIKARFGYDHAEDHNQADAVAIGLAYCKFIEKSMEKY